METLPALKPNSLQEINSMAQIFHESGLFPDIKSAAQATVKIIAGAELGVPPMAAMRGVDIIQGQISLKPAMLAALLKQSGKYDYREVTHNEKEAAIEFFQDGKSVGISCFSWEDATKAGLVGKDNYKKHGKAMMWARAMSAGIRKYAPEIGLGGVYAAGEIEVDIEPRNTPMMYEPEEEPDDIPDPPMSIRQFWAQARAAMSESGKTENELRAYLESQFQLTSTKELNGAQQREVIEWLREVASGGGDAMMAVWGNVISALWEADVDEADFIAFIKNDLSGFDEAETWDEIPDKVGKHYSDMAVNKPEMWQKIIDAVKGIEG